jgi:hypothetical protein
VTNSILIHRGNPNPSIDARTVHLIRNTERSQYQDAADASCDCPDVRTASTPNGTSVAGEYSRCGR